MKKIKRALAALLAVALLLGFAACGADTPESPAAPTAASDEREYKTAIAVPEGALSLGMAKLRSDRAYAYDVTACTTAEEIVPLLKDGSADIAILPLDLALDALEETDHGIQMLAVTTLSLFYAVENGSTIKKAEDLKGKTVYAAAKDSSGDRLLRAGLAANGIDPETDLTIEYVDTEEALTDAALDGTAAISLMTEPNASRVCVEDENLRIALDLNGADEDALAQGCLVVRKAYAAAHADLLAEFLTFYEVSVNFVSYNLQAAAAIYAENGYFSSRDVALSALPRMHIVFLTGEKMRTIAQATYTILNGADALPDASFYYAAEE